MSKKLVLIIITVTVLAAAAGYLVGASGKNDSSSVASNSSESISAQNATQEASKQEVTPQNGKITGSFTFPSSRIPSDLIACAENMAGSEIACSTNQIEDDKFIYGVGYEIEVPVGEYYVYAKIGETGNKAYYNQYSESVSADGEWPNYDTSKCSDKDRKLAVTVTENKATEGITLADWYFDSSCGELGQGQ